jgi:hypothetical protein
VDRVEVWSTHFAASAVSILYHETVF